MTLRDESKVLRRRGEYWFSLAGTAFIALLGMYVALTGVPQDESFGDFLGMLGVATGVLWGLGAILTSKVVVDGRGMRVDNWFTRFWIPWSVVARIEAESAVHVVLTDGNEVPLGIGGWSLLDQLRGNRYQHRVRERLERARAAGHDADGASSEVIRTWRPGLLRLAGWALVFFGLATPHLI